MRWQSPKERATRSRRTTGDDVALFRASDRAQKLVADLSEHTLPGDVLQGGLLRLRAAIQRNPRPTVPVVGRDSELGELGDLVLRLFGVRKPNWRK